MADSPAARAWLWGSALLTVGALAVVVALAPPAGASPVLALSWLLFTGSSVHVASTGWLFTVPAVRCYARAHVVRCMWVPVTLVVGTAGVAMAMPPAAFQWLLLPYFCWQFFHYQKQNVGMAALAASARRVRPLLPDERRPLLLAGAAAIGALVAEPRLLGIGIELGTRWLLPLAAVAYAMAVLAGLVALGRRPAAQRPAGFCATYLTSLLFCLPVFVFASPYAAIGGMTVAHGLQYLLLIALIAGSGRPAPSSSSTADVADGGAVRDSEAGARSAGQAGSSRLVRLAVLANVALIGGAALSGASHSHNAGPAGRLVFGAYLGVVMAHFVIDAGLWRMRDPLARKFVASSLPYLMPEPKRAATDRSLTDIGCTP